jgi:demethylmenaquinone methyltransferase/2-methoxy-6-polyprenyl-1,4-benzoquinol methylase
MRSALPESSQASAPAWSEQDLTGDPHAKADKATRVQRMFSAIAGSYDLNNRLHSLGRDQAWRRAAVRMAGVQTNDVVLDVACGTGDLALAFAEASPKRVMGSDFTFQMLTRARQKSTRAPAPVHYHAADALRLPLPDESVDVVSIAFGIRNVADSEAALAEFYRVLRPGGRMIVLEFGLPRQKALRAGYNFYFNHVLPRTAALVARDRSGAYKYLPRSVNTYLDRPAMKNALRDTGFTQVTSKALTFGIAICYRGVKAPTP